jgi:hypothetical protein
MIDVDILFTPIPVREFEAARDWYRRLIGRTEDVVAHDEEVMWRLADPAWLYVVRDDERAGHALVTLCVPDLEQAIDDLGSRGITAGPIEAIGTAGRKALVTDLDGNCVAFIEVRGRAT